MSKKSAKSLEEDLAASISAAQAKQTPEPEPQADPHWLDIWEAVDACQLRFGGSRGAAQAKLCEACASGIVRWARVTYVRSNPSPIAGSSDMLTRRAWCDATIDEAHGDVISGGLRFRGAQISASDLKYWLDQQAPAKDTPQQRPQKNKKSRSKPQVAACKEALATLYPGQQPPRYSKALLNRVNDWLKANERSTISPDTLQRALSDLVGTNK